jgi:hypothetical protein
VGLVLAGKDKLLVMVVKMDLAIDAFGEINKKLLEVVLLLE